MRTFFFAFLYTWDEKGECVMIERIVTVDKAVRDQRVNAFLVGKDPELDDLYTTGWVEATSLVAADEKINEQDIEVDAEQINP